MQAVIDEINGTTDAALILEGMDAETRARVTGA